LAGKDGDIMAELIQREDSLNTGREKLNNAIKAFNETVVEGDSSVEAAQARVDSEGNVYNTLKERLDDKDTKFSSQLEQTATKEELYRESNAKADKSYVDSKVSSIDDRINDIITNPAEGVSEQEIIDARDGKGSLGENIRDIRQKASVGLENKVVDGNFTNGLDHHFVTFGTGEIIDGNLLLIADSDIPSGVVNQTMLDHAPQNQVWYFKARMRAIDAGANFIGVGARTSKGNRSGNITNPVAGQWYTVSHYMDVSDFEELSDSTFFHASVWGSWNDNPGKQIEVDYYMAFNLTEFYGRGKEPSKEEMDNLLSNSAYFEGDFGSGRLSNKISERQNVLDKEVKEAKESELENIVANGDFSNGLNGWVSSTNTLSRIEEGKLVFSMSTNGTSARVIQNINTNYDIGDKVYLSGYFTPKSDLPSWIGFAVYSNTSANTQYLRSSDLGLSIEIDKTIKVSGIVDVATADGDMALQVRTQYPSGSETVGKEVVADNIIGFNLTKFFGVGNEPTTEAFEKMLSQIDIKEGKTDLAQTQKAVTQYTLSTSGRGSVVRPLAVVSFDDQNLSDYEKAFPFLQARGIKGTSYVITSRVGDSGKMDWTHLRELKNAGWGIEFHTHNHINLDQTSDSVIRQDFEQGIQTFLDNGFPKPRHLAYPYGAGTDSDRVKNVISEYIKTARNSRGYFAGINNTYDDIDFLRMYGLSIDMNEHREDRIPQIKQMMEHAATNNEIVFLYAHRLVDGPPTNDGVPETIFSMWADLIDYAIDLDFEFVTTNEMYLRVLNYKRAIGQL